MFLKINQELERCNRVMRQRVSPHIYPVLSSCTVESYSIPGEPMPSREFFRRLDAGEIDFEPFDFGSPWGTTWGTVWFRVTGTTDSNAAGAAMRGDTAVSHAAADTSANAMATMQPGNPKPTPQDVPAGAPLELLVDLGWYPHSTGGHIEGLVYRPDGTVIKAVHPLNTWVPLVNADGSTSTPINPDGTFTVYLEAACNPLLLGVPPFIETELGERATGRPDEPYIFRSLNVVAFDRRFQAYYTDLEVMQALIGNGDKDSPRHWQLAKALQRSLNIYDEQHPDTVDAARQALQPVLRKPANASAMRVSAVGHAHIDSAWLWPVRETRRKVARTVSNVLALMDEYPDFMYAMSSAQQYAWFEQDHPDLFAKVLRRIREGRFIPVGGMWVESDGMLPCGESLIRQISFGKRYFREHLGVDPDGVWLPDSFGYTGAWPQIARRAGYHWFLTQKISWNDTTKFPHHSFLWEGIDGTPIFTHFPPSDTYAANVTVKELDYAERNFQDKDVSDRSLMLFGYGDGGGGPTREMMERLHRFENLEGVSRVRIEAPDAFFTQAREQIEQEAGIEFPRWKGELYLELHRGTLTAQQAMKRGCRHEESWLRTVEYLCALASLRNPDYAYPRQELDDIWRTLLLDQFHDILPGSAIAWVHREARENYRRDLARLKAIAQRACDDLRTGESVEVPRAISQFRVDGAAWEPYALSEGDASHAVASTRTPEGGCVMDNGLLRVTVNPNGTVGSIIDLANGRELVAEQHALGALELLRNEPSVWDAWEIERDSLLRSEPVSAGTIEAVNLDDECASVHVRTAFGSSDSHTTICLNRGSRQLDFDLRVEWHERERFLKMDLPLAVSCDSVQYDCQYGLISRPVVKNTASDEAKYESSTGRFARFAENGYAVAVANDGLYGSDVAPIPDVCGTGRGTMFRLSLLTAPVFPDPHTDQGTHRFRFSVVADASIPRTIAAAYELNAPAVEHLPRLEPLARLTDVHGLPIIDWIKLADDGSKDVILRIFEAAGGRASARLSLGAPLDGDGITVREVNVLEDDDIDVDLPRAIPCGTHRVQDVEISLRPFQLATLRLHRTLDGEV